jgi:hypothetical protein
MSEYNSDDEDEKINNIMNGGDDTCDFKYSYSIGYEIKDKMVCGMFIKIESKENNKFNNDENLINKIFNDNNNKNLFKDITSPNNEKIIIILNNNSFTKYEEKEEEKNIFTLIPIQNIGDLIIKPKINDFINNFLELQNKTVADTTIPNATPKDAAAEEEEKAKKIAEAEEEAKKIAEAEEEAKKIAEAAKIRTEAEAPDSDDDDDNDDEKKKPLAPNISQINAINAASNASNKIINLIQKPPTIGGNAKSPRSHHKKTPKNKTSRAKDYIIL